VPTVVAVSLALLPLAGTVVPLAWFVRTSRRPA